METRFEVDARFTPTSFGVFRAFDAERSAMQLAADLIDQGFGWVRVQEASAFVDDTTPAVLFEREAA